MLLLERLLPLDHKAISNNTRTTAEEYIQPKDLDKIEESVFASSVVPPGDGPVELEAAADDIAVLCQVDSKEQKQEKIAEPKVQKKEKAIPRRRRGRSGLLCRSRLSRRYFNARHSSKKQTQPLSLADDPELDFKLYENFWGLQEQLQNPKILFEMHGKWASFHELLLKLLKLFLRHPTQDHDPQAWSKPEPVPLRHAPRADALVAQLEDPGFRQEFLTQVLIAFHTLEHREERGSARYGGIIANQAPNVRKEFAELKKQLESALQQTKKGFPDILKQVLDSEAHWISWKRHSCQAFERDSLEMLNMKPIPHDKLPKNPRSAQPQNITLEPYVQSLLDTLKEPQWKLPAVAKDNVEEAQQSMRIYTMQVMCDKYAERLFQEEQPDAVVEDECKMKNNKVYMWQFRRLFWFNHSSMFTQVDVNENAKMDVLDFMRIRKSNPLCTESDFAGEGRVFATDTAMSAVDGAGDERDELTGLDMQQVSVAAVPATGRDSPPVADDASTTAKTESESVMGPIVAAEAPSATIATAEAPGAKIKAETPGETKAIVTNEDSLRVQKRPIADVDGGAPSAADDAERQSKQAKK